jgi:hypothetical protein
MHTLEESLFAPLLAAVKQGRIKTLRLVLSHRDGHLEPPPHRWPSANSGAVRLLERLK